MRRERPAPRDPGAVMESLPGRTGWFVRHHIPIARNARCSSRDDRSRGATAPAVADRWSIEGTRPPPRHPTCHNDRRESRQRARAGGASLASVRKGPAPPAERMSCLAEVADHGGAGRSRRPDASTAAHRRRPSRCPSCRPGRTGRRAAGAPVRRVPGRGRARDRREGRCRPDRGRPVRLEHPAAPFGRPGGRRAQAAGCGEDSDGHHPRDARRLRPVVALPRPRPRRAGRLNRRRRPGHRPDAGSSEHPSRVLRRRRARSRLRHEAGAAQPAPRPQGHAAATARPGTSAMVHGSLAIPDRTDRDEVVVTREEIEATRARLPRARPLALHAAGQGRDARRTPIPAPRSPWP